MMYQIKKIIPKPLVQLYHYWLALLANFVYGRPSEKLIVIGVTGTSGKSTVVYLVTKMMEKAGFRVGAASTILFKVDKKEWLNDKKMTMVGRFALQKLIKQMVRANCQYAVIETTSQGIEQFRHLGINYDILVFTNLYPEHIEAHGGFENYKKAKLKLFAKLKSEPIKIIAEQKIKKTIVANLDSEHAADFLNHWAEEKYGYTTTNQSSTAGRVIRAEKIVVDALGSQFAISEQFFHLPLLGQHNVSNALAAICVGRSQGLSFAALSDSLGTIQSIPGRLEFIDEGQPFKVIVDYAFEPKAVEALYQVVRTIPHERLIHVLGSTGGGRDISRRPILGQIAGTKADIVIVTNEDPYDENPEEIINQVAEGSKAVGKKNTVDLFKITDRGKAIAKAIRIAKSNDIVLVTGKGSEQAIAGPKNTLTPWDDRRVVREELKRIH